MYALGITVPFSDESWLVTCGAGVTTCEELLQVEALVEPFVSRLIRGEFVGWLPSKGVRLSADLWSILCFSRTLWTVISNSM
jgi:hypothetical protein